MKNFLHVAFYILALATMLEYYLVCGLFTGIAMLTLVIVAGIVNAVYSACRKDYHESILFIISTAALCIGYLKVLQ